MGTSINCWRTSTKRFASFAREDNALAERNARIFSRAGYTAADIANADEAFAEARQTLMGTTERPDITSYGLDAVRRDVRNGFILKQASLIGTHAVTSTIINGEHSITVYGNGEAVILWRD